MRAILALAILLMATPSSAEFLVAELTFDDMEFGGFGSNPPSAFRYSFSIGDQYVGRWSRDVSAADVGQVFTPEPDQLALMARGIADDANDNVGFGVGVGPALQYALSERELLDGAYVNASLNLHVPSLRAYPLSDVRITIDSLRIVQQMGFWQYGGGLTARLYGVPEPASWMRAGLGWILIHRR